MPTPITSDSAQGGPVHEVHLRPGQQRHAAASFMLAQGVPLRVAQEVLGHSTIAVTADLYSHLAPTATRDATDRVGELLFGAS